MKNVNVLSLTVDNGLTVTAVDLDNTSLCKDLTIVQNWTADSAKPAGKTPEGGVAPARPKILNIQLLEEEEKLIINDITLEGAVLDILVKFLQQ